MKFFISAWRIHTDFQRKTATTPCLTRKKAFLVESSIDVGLLEQVKISARRFTREPIIAAANVGWKYKDGISDA